MIGLSGLWLILISPFVGSFLGVLGDRLPHGRDVIRARSACDSCGARLSPRDLVPLLSYLALRGRCRHCGAAIPPHLPLVEALAVLAALAAVAVQADTLLRIDAACWLWALVALGLTDWRVQRLPDPLTAALLVFAVPLGLALPGRGLADVAVSAVAGVAAFWAIRLAYRHLRGREGLGLGDVKLMAGIGAALPLAALPLVTLMAALLALATVALHRGLRRQALSQGGVTALPFGSFLAAAAALVWVALPRA